MNVTLLAHTQLATDFYENLSHMENGLPLNVSVTDGQAVALTAIRTCYSANKPSEIVTKEGKRYFGKKASDGEGGTEADRLIRQIVASKHVSTLEHLSFTFAIEGVSRALLAQLIRHRVGFSFSVQSQRYVRLGSDDKSGGFDYVMPGKIAENDSKTNMYVGYDVEYFDNTGELFKYAMNTVQDVYDKLREAGVPAEDARAVLPNATATNLVMTANLRSLLDFYAKRKPGNGAQKEISDLAETLKNAVIEVEPWAEAFFK